MDGISPIGAFHVPHMFRPTTLLVPTTGPRPFGRRRARRPPGDLKHGKKSPIWYHPISRGQIQKNMSKITASKFIDLLYAGRLLYEQHEEVFSEQEY